MWCVGRIGKLKGWSQVSEPYEGQGFCHAIGENRGIAIGGLETPITVRLATR
jgi:hypothetical protein